jgi:hypothetical protein
MSIFEQQVISQPDQVALIKKEIYEKSTALLNTMIEKHAEIFNLAWNSDGVHPQAVFDAVGAEGIELLQASQGVQNLIQALRPSYVKLEAPYQFNVVDNKIVVTG